MYTCPEKDIHSLYIDNELPQTYIADYENHIASCEKCRRELESLKSMRAAFEADSKSLDFSKKDLDDSFARLQAKMSYSSNVQKKKTFVLDLKPLSYVAIGAAAALALVILPSKATKSAGSSGDVMAQSSSFQPVARTVLYAPADAAIPLDGEVSPATLVNLFADEDAVMDVDVGVSPSLSAFPAGLSTVSYGSQIGRQGASPTLADRTVSSLASYDMFTQVPSQNVPVTSSGENSTFSVEFSLGSFHFKAQGSGK